MPAKFLLNASRILLFAIQFILLVLLVVYLVGMFFWRELGALQRYEKQFLAATLFWIVSFAIIQASDLRKCATELTTVNAGVAEVGRLVALAGESAEVKIYEDGQVYEATRAAVEQARERVWVSYLRNQGPAQRTDAARHIEACRRWALQDSRHRFRRVILYGNGESMAEFFASELKTVRVARAKGCSYGVKLLTDSRHSAEAFSVGIYDDDLVILTYATDVHRLVGVSIRSEQVVSKCFRVYFDSLWGSPAAVSIEKHKPDDGT